MAYSALSILLQSLEAFLNPNGRLVFVRSERLQALTENLKFFQDFLQNSEDKCYDEEMMKSIEGKIVEVVPRARHVIQEFARSTRGSKDLLIDIFDEKCSIHQILQQILQEIDSIKAEAINIGVTMSTMPKNTISVGDGIKMLIDFDREDGDSTEEEDAEFNLDKEQLKEKLHRKLKGQRFLIVMDDLWSTEAWDSMRRCFPDDNNGSRILLTTRLKNLAAYVSLNHTPHEMRFLDKEQSWELMHYQISESVKKICPDELVEIGKKIAEKCRGLPLSILVIAGVLANMSETRDCWEKVAENMNSLFARDPEKCIEILALSYNYLPHHLKACFLYMCAFPEDCEIDCQRLYQLWVAEGFVKAEYDRNLEDLAEQYLEDLVKRSLVLVGRRRSNGGIKTCQLHDILRDLALREARKENFMQVIMRNIEVHSKCDTVPCRLSFHSGSCGNFQPDPTVQLNSFLCFDVGFGSVPDISFTLSNFNFKFLKSIGYSFSAI